MTNRKEMKAKRALASTVSSYEKDSDDIGVVRLKRELGALYGVAIIIGLTVGGGIYISPQTVLRNAGSPGLTLIAWVLGGVNALLGALVFVEIGIHIPVAGEGYPYLCELYDPYVGFMYVWQYLLLVRPGSNALKFIIFGRYLLKPLFQQCEIPRVAIMLLSTIMSVLITALNCTNLKFIAKGQSLMSVVSVATLSVLASLGIWTLTMGHVENLKDPFKDSSNSPGDFVLALYATVYSYNGWSALNFIIEEVRNPNRTLPLAIVTSILLMTALYMLVNLTYLVVLTKEEALSSEAVAISTMMKISNEGGWIMSVLIALTACSSCNSGHLVASRLAFSASRNGHLPSALSFISISQAIPIVSVLFIGSMVILFVWVFEAEFLLINVVFSGVLGDFLISVGYLRRRITSFSSIQDDDKLKMPLIIHVLYSLSLLVFAVIPLITNPVESATGCFLVVLTSSMYYLAFVKFKVTSKWTWTGRINLFLQKLFNCAPEDESN